MKTLAHAHKLRRHTYKSTGTRVYFCVLNCSFKVEDKLALGKRVICWRCGREFTMNENSIRLARPHCNSCTKTKTEVQTEVTPESVATNASENSAESLRERLTSLHSIGREDEDL